MREPSPLVGRSEQFEELNSSKVVYVIGTHWFCVSCSGGCVPSDSRLADCGHHRSVLWSDRAHRLCVPYAGSWLWLAGLEAGTFYYFCGDGMNERLRELIKQHGVNITIDGLGYGEGNVEGLAELIVRECLKMCASDVDARLEGAPYETADEFDKGFIDGQDCCCEMIREHFGVEE